jgi:hypothetical protein
MRSTLQLMGGAAIISGTRRNQAARIEFEICMTGACNILPNRFIFHLFG